MSENTWEYFFRVHAYTSEYREVSESTTESDKLDFSGSTFCVGALLTASWRLDRLTLKLLPDDRLRESLGARSPYLSSGKNTI